MALKRFSPLVALVLAVVILAPALAFGAGIPGSIVTCSGAVAEGNQKACTICDIAQVAQNVLNTGIYVAVFLSAVLFAWAGWLYLTNIANPGQIERAKSIFFSVFIGLVIILAAWIVIDTLMKTLVPQSGPFGPWNKIC